jgi:hypothetical protein
MRLVLTKNVQTKSEHNLREVQLAQERVDYSERVPPPPPQIQVGERHLSGMIDMCHELRRPDRSFRGKRILGDVILLQ